MRTRPDVIRQISVDGRLLGVDEQGFLIDPEDWSEAVAYSLAREMGIELTDAHLSVINFMRSFLAENGVTADARFVFRFLETTTNAAGKPGREFFFELFPYGYVGQACKIAGMRQPRAWSTG